MHIFNGPLGAFLFIIFYVSKIIVDDWIQNTNLVLENKSATSSPWEIHYVFRFCYMGHPRPLFR